MKKLFALILASALLLSSCTVTTLPKENTPPNDVQQADKNVFSLETLPDIGSFSGKQPKERFYEDLTYDFIPSDEYGEVIPYIGNYKTFKVSDSADWEYEQGYGYYGFCTPDGKIVMDASPRNNYVNSFETDDGFTYYSVSRDISQKDDAPDEYLSSENWLIPKSGAWIIRLNPGSWVSSVGGGVIITNEMPLPGEEGQQRCVFYDYDGNELFFLENTDSVGIYSNGFMTVTNWQGNEYTQSYINMKGEVVLGPYKSCGNFNVDGTASVTDLNGKCYLIDKEGNRLTSGDYDNIFYEESQDGKTRVYQARNAKNNKMRDVLDTKGNIIGTVSGPSYISFRFPDNGEILYYYTKYDENEKGYPIYSTEKMIWIKLSDNTEFTSLEGGLAPNDYGGNDNLFIHKEKIEGQNYGKATLFDGDGKTVAVIDNLATFFDRSDDGRYITYTSGSINWTETATPEGGYITTVSEDTRKMHIYDTVLGKDVASYDGGGYIGFVGKNDRYARITTYAEDYGGVFVTAEKSILYDLEENREVLSDCSIIEYVGSADEYFFNVVKGNKCSLYDENLNPVLTIYNE